MALAKSLSDLGIAQQDQLVLLELPALSNGVIPYDIVKSADMSIMIARADKSWSANQALAVKDWKRKTGRKPFLILNTVQTHHLNEFIGDVRGHKNIFINYVRRMAKFEFSSIRLK